MSSDLSASGVVLRPAVAGDADALWRMLHASADEVIGMSALPATPDAAHQICQDTSKTVAELATGSFAMKDGEARRLLFVAAARDEAGPDGAPEAIVGLTGVTFKQAVQNLAVKVTTSSDGQGLVMSSSSLPWTRTELDSSFIAPEARGRRLGTLLSRGRFMLLHLVRSQVPQTVASHLRGRFEPDGTAPFWRCFGAEFAPRWKSSIEAELALAADPNLLDDLAGHLRPVTATVLKSLGPVNAASLPAFHLLTQEGMKPNGMYDPIDGGPTVIAELANTVTGRTRTHGRAAVSAAPVSSPAASAAREGGRTAVSDSVHSLDALVSVATVDRFRVIRTMVGLPNSTEIALSAKAAELLGVTSGSLITAAGLHPHPSDSR